MKYQQHKKAIILLADGTIFHGKSIGIDGTSTGEICFNTGMTGYQEIFTDPSYFGQLMVATNAHIGNYGVNKDEVESEGIKIAGLICRNFSFTHSRVDSDGNLKDWFSTHNLVAISDVDTRALVSYIRDNGAMNAVISTEVDDIDALKKQLAAIPNMNGLELASKVSTKETYFIGDEKATYKIAALDIGIKKNILRNLAGRDAYIKVFPYNAKFEELAAWKPDGYFISNGPGDPEPLIEAQNLAKEIIKLHKLSDEHQVSIENNLGRITESPKEAFQHYKNIIAMPFSPQYEYHFYNASRKIRETYIKQRDWNKALSSIKPWQRSSFQVLNRAHIAYAQANWQLGLIHAKEAFQKAQVDHHKIDALNAALLILQNQNVGNQPVDTKKYDTFIKQNSTRIWLDQNGAALDKLTKISNS